MASGDGAGFKRCSPGLSEPIPHYPTLLTHARKGYDILTTPFPRSRDFGRDHVAISKIAELSLASPAVLAYIKEIPHSHVSAAPITRPSLLLRLRDAGDERAWQEFVEIYTPLVFGFVRRRGLQEADAADVAQEVMQAVARSIGSFGYQPEKGSFRSWLYTVTRNRFNNFLKRQQRQPRGTGDTAIQELLEELPCPESDDGWDREFHQWLLDWACAQVRSEFQTNTWQAFLLTAVEGKSPQDAAAALGSSVGAVYIARSRVTARIRDKVREASDESVLLLAARA
jgi:RNA polymerase sigma factor (sigma-70 family)